MRATEEHMILQSIVLQSHHYAFAIRQSVKDRLVVYPSGRVELSRVYQNGSTSKMAWYIGKKGFMLMEQFANQIGFEKLERNYIPRSKRKRLTGERNAEFTSVYRLRCNTQDDLTKVVMFLSYPGIAPQELLDLLQLIEDLSEVRKYVTHY